MSNRRVELTNIRKEGDKVVADVAGLAGEEFLSETYQPYGFATNPEEAGESVVLEQNGDPDNYVVLPPGGYKVAVPGTTVLYHGDTEIIVKGDGDIEIKGSGKITTDMDIISGGVSLQNHTHGGVESGPSNTGKPNL